jgi:DnaJ-class molecular chaperone
MMVRNHTSWFLKLVQIYALLSIVSAKGFSRLFGIVKSAASADIKKVDFLETLELHPAGKSKAEGDPEQFSKISRSHGVLTDDDEKRKIYDLHAANRF